MWKRRVSEEKKPMSLRQYGTHVGEGLGTKNKGNYL